MQSTTPVADEQINWALGLKALLAAASLALVAAGSGSQAPMLGAVLIAGWALVKPLRLLSWALSPGLLRFAGWVAVRIVGLAAAATVLGFAVNSRSPVVATVGSVLFMGMLAAVAGIAAWAGWRRGRMLWPRALAWGEGMAARARVQAAALVGSLVSR
jgi:hypothetical protein